MRQQLLLAQVMLLGMGILGVSAAQPTMGENPGMLAEHAAKALFCVILTLLLAKIPVRAYLRLGWPMWLGSLFLLLMVLVFGVGTAESQGTRRWLDLHFIRFQPSELAKLALVTQLASFFARRGVYSKIISATAMISITTLLILLEPDLGTAVSTFILGVVVMYSAGVRITNIAAFLLALGLFSLPLISVFLEKNPYIKERIFMHSEREAVLTTGLDQVGRAHRDLGLGGFWGVGPDAPRYNLFASHTDFVVASVGFGFGLIGVLSIIFAYWMIAHVCLKLASKAAKMRPFSPELHGASTLATGCMCLIVGQALMNLGVVSGLLPVSGVTLPLVSYGFSSMLVMSAALGILHSAVRTIEDHPRKHAAAQPAPQVAPAEG